MVNYSKVFTYLSTLVVVLSVYHVKVVGWDLGHDSFWLSTFVSLLNFCNDTIRATLSWYRNLVHRRHVHYSSPVLDLYKTFILVVQKDFLTDIPHFIQRLLRFQKQGRITFLSQR